VFCDELLGRARESGDEQVLAPTLTAAAITSRSAGHTTAALVRDGPSGGPTRRLLVSGTKT
jgi:hypothetical protein